MHQKIVMGEFPSEIYWDEASVAKLPHIQLQSSSVYNGLMDELLAAFCDDTTTLYTKADFNPDLKNYFHRIGIDFVTEKAEMEDKCSIFEDYYKKHASAVFYASELVPFAVIDGADAVMTLVSGEKKCLPSLECVKKVNSKIYSTNLGILLGVNNYGQVINSLEDLDCFLAKKLEQSKDGIVLKEAFGVSGKGSLRISSCKEANVVRAYLAKQVAAGKSIELVGEIFFADKVCDFSETFVLSPDGRIEDVYLSQMINNHLSFSGTKDLSPEYVSIIQNSRYFDVIEEVAKNLHKEGYWGPVCVDSMILGTGTIIPIVEINARLSLSRIKYAWDRRFCIKASEFHQLQINMPQFNQYKDFLAFLEGNKLLFSPSQGCGVIPLSANMLFPNAESGCKGKFYYLIAAPDQFELEKIKIRIKNSTKHN